MEAGEQSRLVLLWVGVSRAAPDARLWPFWFLLAVGKGAHGLALLLPLVFWAEIHPGSSWSFLWCGFHTRPAFVVSL